jgi:hypothetical protein
LPKRRAYFWVVCIVAERAIAERVMRLAEATGFEARAIRRLVEVDPKHLGESQHRRDTGRKPVAGIRPKASDRYRP